MTVLGSRVIGKPRSIFILTAMALHPERAPHLLCPPRRLLIALSQSIILRSLFLVWQRP